MNIKSNIDGEKEKAVDDFNVEYNRFFNELDGSGNRNSPTGDRYDNYLIDSYQSSDNNDNYNRSEFSKEKTRVVYGKDKTTRLILQTLNNAKSRWYNYADSQGPTIAMGIHQLRKGMREAHKRGTKIRYITEITKHNINYCKELMKIAEVRHLDNAKGGMAISENEYIATAHLQEAKPVSYLIHSNVKEIVEQQQYIFESLWSNAVSAPQRIKEIEDGYERIERRVLDDQQEIENKIKSLSRDSEEIMICSDIGLLKIVHDSFFSEYQKIVDRYEHGYQNGVKCITHIRSQKDVDIVKLFMDIGVKIRIVSSLPALNFLVTDRTFLSNAERKSHDEDRRSINNMFTTNDILYINQYKAVFEQLWENGRDVMDVIEDFERGLDNERVDVISRPANAENLYLDLLRSSNKDIMIILPTTNAIQRHQKMMVFDLINRVAIDRNVKVKILIPKTKNSLEFERAKKDKDLVNSEIKNNNNQNIQLRYIQTLYETRSTILIVDKKVSFVIELKDDTKDTFREAIGLSTYSNSKAAVLSYVFIFESLWGQTELYEQLEKREELQKDFNRITAHELRNPLQSILMYSEIIKSHMKKNGSKATKVIPEEKNQINDYVDIIRRNTKKMASLTNNILDITKIETDSLKLYKETIDLRIFLLEHIIHYETQMVNNINDFCDRNITNRERCKTRLDYSQLNEIDSQESFLVEADTIKISQIVSNLLDNACSFTNDNDLIRIEMKKELINDQIHAIVSIRDTGRGINKEIMPKLFTKFASSSENGTGLGLFISKSIIESHGGKIWAKNNEDGKGATFSFSLPFDKK
ncbi:MAG: ATP-binding protein [Candidatus Nitrosocosmicus sp.]